MHLIIKLLKMANSENPRANFEASLLVSWVERMGYHTVSHAIHSTTSTVLDSWMNGRMNNLCLLRS